MDKTQVEGIIAQLEQAGTRPTYEAILQQTGGGSRRDLAAILHELRPTNGVGSMAPPTAAERFQEATALYDVSYAKYSELHVKDKTPDGLSDDETLQHLLLERRLSSLLPRLEALKAEVVREGLQADVSSLDEHWPALVEQKHERLQTFIDAVRGMRHAWASVMEVHQAQEALTTTMPTAIREKWSFPDVGTYGMWLTSRLSVPQAWNDILLSNQGRRPIDLKALIDIDPGAKQLPRLITDLRKKED